MVQDNPDFQNVLPNRIASEVIPPVQESEGTPDVLITIAGAVSSLLCKVIVR